LQRKYEIRPVTIEKRTFFIPSLFNSKSETVSLALHHPNFASLGYTLTALIIRVKSFFYLLVSHNMSVIDQNRQTDRPTDDNS